MCYRWRGYDCPYPIAFGRLRGAHQKPRPWPGSGKCWEEVKVSMDVSLNTIFELAKFLKKRTVAITGRADPAAFKALLTARDRGWLDPLACGQSLEPLRPQMDLLLPNADIREARDGALELLENGKVEALLDTGPLDEDLFSFLDHLAATDNGTRVISYVSVFRSVRNGRLTLFTDTLIHTSPSLKEKAGIIQNAASVAEALGIEHPKVAALGPIEIVNPAIPSTVDAAALAKMAERGQQGDVIVEGPLAMDNAESAEAAHHKGIESPVPGDVDIYLFPDLESALLSTQFVRCLGPFEVAGVVAGTKAPVIIHSPADSPESWLHNIVLGLLQGKRI
ncbi:MAG: hypothetical protein DRG76_05055 [Deltaproteobacteria bacterium]|nr:MAG: hypothetical protein DRG76_05055 [Deltaproteobacteria bacterium]